MFSSTGLIKELKFNTVNIRRCICTISSLSSKKQAISSPESVLPAVGQPVFPLQHKETTDEGFRRHKIIDRVRIHVRGGSGGQGSSSSGGIGGDGGSIYMKAVKGASLATFNTKARRRICAEHGPHAKHNRLVTRNGKDVYLMVPMGTEIKNGNEQLIMDLNEDGEEAKVANGGAGGCAKYDDFNGQRGEKRNIVLELKTIADVALTGFPNAGKSSLLRGLSRARPKVGDYPFTTINPMVGSIFYSDDTQAKVVDLPGLIENAHINKGMGHRFLRHIERTKVIQLVVDVNGFQLNVDSEYRSPLDTVLVLLKELALYQDLLLHRPAFIVLNKMDTPDARRKADTFLEELATVDLRHPVLSELEYGEEILESVKTFCRDDFENVLPVSAKDQQGLEVVKSKIYESLPRLEPIFNL